MVAQTDDGEPNAWAAFAWGALSASSLVFGALIGIWRRPSHVQSATMMAFGGGALLEALSIELFAHILANARGGHGPAQCVDGEPQEPEVDRPYVFIAIGAALIGGLIFAGIDRVVSNHGAFLRKASTLKTHVRNLRYSLNRRLMARLQKVPMFEVLSQQQLQTVIKSMKKERYTAGAVIFNEVSSDSSVFFLLSGKVDLSVTTRYSVTGKDGDIVDEDVVDHFRLMPNDIFGEMALFTSETMEARAVAASPTCVLHIDAGTLHRLLASNRRLQDFVAMTAIDRLREAGPFRHATPSTVARLVSFTRQAEFEAGEVLFNDVDGLCPIYLVVLGRVEVVSSSVGTGDVERRIVGANELLGTEHLQLGRAMHATATALERTTVLIIQRADIDKLCERDERFRQAILAGSTKALQFPDGVPPEGVAAPTKMLLSLEEMGWHRQTSQGVPECDIIPNERSSVDVQGSGHQHKSPKLVAAEPKIALRNELEMDKFGFDMGDEGAELGLEELMENEDAAAEAGGHHAAHAPAHGGSAQAAIMIWIGILIDAVPESVVMGILVNSATQGTLLAFVVGVFLANFPEAMSSAGTMREHGMRRGVIIVMWASIVFLTGLGAFVGAAVFPPGSKDDPTISKVIASIEGCCGGAMLCMIANTVLPEAFEQGGNVVGLSTLSGFLVAIAVSVAA